MKNTGVHSPLDSSIDKSPYVNIMEDGLITAVRNEGPDNDKTMASLGPQVSHDLKLDSTDAIVEQNEDGSKMNASTVHETIPSSGQNAYAMVHETTPSSGQNAYEDRLSKIFNDMTGQVKRSMNQVSRQSGKSMWLLAYIAIVTTWPLLGSFIRSVFGKKLKVVSPAARLGR